MMLTVLIRVALSRTRDAGASLGHASAEQDLLFQPSIEHFIFLSQREAGYLEMD